MGEARRRSLTPPEPAGFIEDLMWRARIETPEAEEKRAGALRRNCGDVDLWLGAAAEGPEPAALPAGVSRAEFFAVMAVWKAADLAGITRRVYQQVRASWNQEEVAAETVHEYVEQMLKNPLFQGVALMHQVSDLSSEITRAATLALEAEYFEAELEKARAAGAAEREKALLDARDLHVREAGARGGAMRAAKFEPSKRRAIELYSAPDAKYRSRLAAAEAISRILEAEGLHSKYHFVLQALKDHDAAVEAARARKVDGQPDLDV